MSAERWGALPLGELHAEDRCALCGFKSAFPASALKRTVLAVTYASAMICVDVIGCERRRYNERRKV